MCKREEKLNLTKICQTGEKKNLTKNNNDKTKPKKLKKINGKLGTSNLDAVFFLLLKTQCLVQKYSIL